MSVGVIGSGAFGTALAIALASDGTEVLLWGRNTDAIETMNKSRENARYLPGISLPETLRATRKLTDLAQTNCALLVLPAQKTGSFLLAHPEVTRDCRLVLCAKGVDARTSQLQSQLVPAAAGVLTGPGFAGEIASGKPTALTLASTDDGEALQSLLSRPRLRLYRTTDVVGAQIGGALKNVMAIAAGISIGADLGESARAAIMTRGFAEMRRLAAAMGAQDATLCGLSGMGDLALTCSSDKSRNFAHGCALGRGAKPEAATVEGVATTRATLGLAAQHGVEMPVAQAVATVLEGTQQVGDAIRALLARPLREE